MKKLAIILLLCSTIILLGAAVWKTLEARELRTQAFSADSAAALADSARRVALATLDDSTNAYQRRILQLSLHADSLDQELEERPVIRLPGTVTIDTIRLVDTVQASGEPTDSVQTYQFRGHHMMFGYSGAAQIWPQRYEGIFRVEVFQEEPAEIGVRVGCKEGLGVSSASVLFTADEPFNVVPGEVQQDPDVCNPREPVGFRLLPELSFRGVGWELVKGVGWVMLANFVDDRFHTAKY